MFVRARDNGEPDARGGRVEVRYRPNDGRKYDASVRNLSDLEPEVLPDDTCGDVAPGSDKRASRPGGARPKASSTPEPSPEEAIDGKLIAYTDGACTGNPGPAGLGVVLLSSEGRRECAEYLGDGTNNIAELTAILRAIEVTADDPRPLLVWTDSQYAIGVLSKGWKAKANVDLIADIREKIIGRKISFHYVPGHKGVKWNERCDELARLAITTRASTPFVSIP